MTQEGSAARATSRPALSIGAVTVRVISDGLLPVALSVVTGVPAAEVERLTGASEADGAHLPVNVFVLTVDGRHALVDAGAGPSLSASTGKLAERLARLGLHPDDIGTVLMTHLHPDHVGGLIDPEGHAVYRNADIVVSAEELGFWLGDDPPGVSDRIARNRTFARRALEPYGDRLRVTGAGDPLPGVAAVPLHGHTPGHTGWTIASAETRLLLWGDIVHFGDLQAAQPSASLAFDVDPAQARATRLMILEQAADDGLLIAGAHVAYPGFARVRRDARAYRLEAVERRGDGEPDLVALEETGGSAFTDPAGT